MENSSSDTFINTKKVLEEIRNKLTGLSNSDLTNVHVGQDWSWIPFLKDHLEFLIEQINGVESALKEGPPPVAPEDLARLAEEPSKT